MWFAKWFGGRREEHEDDEPARFTAPHPVRPTASNTRLPAHRKSAQAAQAQIAKSKLKGFDPYNSGAFEVKNAWERTNLK